MSIQEVAVKLLDPGSKQGDKEFRQDVNLLSSLNYPNIVKLIGYAIGVFGPSYIGLDRIL